MNIISKSPVALLNDEGQFIHLAIVWCPPDQRNQGEFLDFWNKSVLPDLKSRNKNVLVIINPENDCDKQRLRKIFKRLGFYFQSESHDEGVLMIENGIVIREH